MKKKWTRFLTVSSLTLVLPFFILTESKKVQAQLTVPVEDLTQQIAENTSIPIFIPSYLPLKRTQVYFSGEVDSKGYRVSFSATPNCGGTTACHYGDIIAEHGKRHIPSSDSRQEYIPVQLANEIKGFYFRGCGAYCTASVQWEYRGVLYRVVIKNGSYEEVVEIANNSIVTGLNFSN